jgi:hypothetical protein
MAPASTRASFFFLDLLQVFAMVSLVKNAITSMIFAVRDAAVLFQASFTSNLQTLEI